MNSLLGDIRYGTRVLLKRPGLSALAIVALAVGIGLTTTMFSIVYAAVIKGLPYEQSERLVAIFRNRPAQGIQFMQVSIHDFVDWREQTRSFNHVAALSTSSLILAGQDEPARLRAAAVSSDFFTLLGIRLAMGRSFVAEEDRQQHRGCLRWSLRLALPYASRRWHRLGVWR